MKDQGKPDALDALERLERQDRKRGMKRSSTQGSRKISEGVFDQATLSSLYKVMRRGFLDDLLGIISTGKEANVYRGMNKGSDVAVKIYSVDASDFRTMEKYIKGDRRFSGWKNRRQLIYNWTKKEYYNLARASEKIRCPRPIGFENNILVMEFIGMDGIPFPRLKDLPPADPDAFLGKVLDSMKELYGLGLVHGDLSEYNILNEDESPCLIDFSMGVLKEHSLADELLERDLHNVLNYFRKTGVVYDKTVPEVLEWIKN